MKPSIFHKKGGISTVFPRESSDVHAVFIEFDPETPHTPSMTLCRGMYGGSASFSFARYPGSQEAQWTRSTIEVAHFR